MKKTKKGRGHRYEKARRRKIPKAQTEGKWETTYPRLKDWQKSQLAGRRLLPLYETRGKELLQKKYLKTGGLWLDS